MKLSNIVQEALQKCENDRSKFSEALTQLAQTYNEYDLMSDLKDFDLTVKEVIEGLSKFLKEDKKQEDNEIFISQGIYNQFQLTSKETNFQNYKTTNIEITSIDSKHVARTENTRIENNNKSKKCKTTTKGHLNCFLYSPLDLLNKEYRLIKEEENTLDKLTLISRIKATEHFNLKTNEIKIYNAICALIKNKRFNNIIFISFNELHKQLGYYSKLRQYHIVNYKKIISKFQYLNINIDMTNATNRNYKNFFKIEGNIQEPLLIRLNWTKAKVKINNRVSTLNGFETVPTKLMKLHFNHEYQTNQYFSQEELQKPENRKKIYNAQQAKLNDYINELYFLQKNNKKQEFTNLSLNKIWEVLKEFDMKSRYDIAIKSFNRSRFLNGNILEIINNNLNVESYILNKNDMLKIFWK
jgi:hypothetical protein